MVNEGREPGYRKSKCKTTHSATATKSVPSQGETFPLPYSLTSMEITVLEGSTSTLLLLGVKHVFIKVSMKSA